MWGNLFPSFSNLTLMNTNQIHVIKIKMILYMKICFFPLQPTIVFKKSVPAFIEMIILSHLRMKMLEKHIFVNLVITWFSFFELNFNSVSLLLCEKNGRWCNYGWSVDQYGFFSKDEACYICFQQIFKYLVILNRGLNILTL